MSAAVDIEHDAAMSAAIILPHFDAVRDVFVEAHTALGLSQDELDALMNVELLINDDAHDTERHFAMTRGDGRQVILAPEAADLGIGTLVPIMAHEWGHVSDLLMPGRWLLLGRYEPAVWDGGASKKQSKRNYRRWLERTDDEIEWAADAIALAVTGKRIGYCGPCLLQCFGGGKPRPKGLR